MFTIFIMHGLHNLGDSYDVIKIQAFWGNVTDESVRQLMSTVA